MSDTTPNLALKIPTLGNPNEPFDWEEFLHVNFEKIDSMKILGGTRIYNAASYTTAGVLSWATLKADLLANGDNAKGVMIYFPPGTYDVVSAGGLVIGTPNAVSGGLWLLGAKGAILTANSGTGASLTDIINVTSIDNVTIVGFTIQGHGADTASCVTNGIRLRDVRRVHIENVFIKEVGYGIVVDTPTVGFLPEDITITGNKILNYNKNGIDVREAGNTTIAKNFIERQTNYIAAGVSTEGHGIRVKPGLGAALLTYEITDNKIITPRRNGVELVNNSDGSAAPAAIGVRGNTVNFPGNHTEPTTELTKTTRGSGVNSNVAGRLNITDNVIREPISHGILIAAATKLVIAINTIEIGGSVRTGLEGLSWHGIATTTSSKAVISGNRIFVDNESLTTFESELRVGIKVTDGDYDAITGNMVHGGYYGIYTYSSDYVTVSANSVNNALWGGGSAIFVDGAAGQTSTAPTVTGNFAYGYAHSINLGGGSRTYVTNPVVVGNQCIGNQGVYYEHSATETQIDRIMCNSGNLGDAPRIFDSPAFSISKTGYIDNGRYIKHQNISVGEMVPNAAATQVVGGPGTDDPAILFDVASDAAYLWVHLRDKEVATGNVTIYLVFSSDTTQQSNVEITWWNFNVDGSGNSIKGNPNAMGNQGVTIAGNNKYQRITVTIPQASIPSPGRHLALKINDTRSSGTHKLWLHSAEIEYVAKYADA